MRFLDFELDLARFELRRGRRRVRIQPKVLDLIVYLARNRERVVPKEELLDALWDSVAVAESSLTQTVKEARRALGDDGGRQRVVQTVRGRGYRFIAPVEEEGREAPEAEPFVGREALLSFLEDELEGAARGRGRSVFLTGEPGIGKSRTAREFAARARARGAWTLVGRCVEGQGAPVHWVFSQIVRAALQQGLVDPAELGAETSAVLRHALPGLEAHLPAAPEPPPPLSDEQARFRLSEALWSVLRGVADRVPLVVLIDDLHCADSSTLELLAYLVEEQRHARILLIGTYREAQLSLDAVRGKRLGALSRAQCARGVLMEGLTRADVSRFVEQVGGAPVPRDVSEGLYDRTGGNPFFLTQIVQVWKAAGAGSAEDLRAEIALPHGVREAIGRHLDVLTESCRDLLCRAAVLGREFEVDVLAQVSGVGVDAALELIEGAVEARVVRPVGSSRTRFEFAHALIPETLYEAMSPSRRRRLHGRCGEALEALRRDEPGRCGELAHHFARAASQDHSEAAVEWSVRAAELATQQVAHEEAVALYEQALDAARVAAPDEARCLELLLALAEAQARAGRVSEARQTFQRAASLARDRGDASALARAALGLDWEVARRGGVGTDPVRLALLGEALGAIGSEESPLRVRLMAALDEALYFEEERPPGPALSREAVEMARRIDDPDALVFALNRRHLVLRHPTGLDERLAISTELVKLAGQRSDPDLIFDAYGSQIHDALERGEVGLMDEALDTFERLAGKLEIPKYLWYADLYRAMRELLAGRFAEAEPRIARAFATGSRVQPDLARLWHVGQMQAMRVEQARAVGFLPEVREMVAAYPIEPLRLSLALAEAHAGQLEPARRALERVRNEGIGGIRRDIAWVLCVAVLAELCDLCEDREAAAALYGPLEPLARQNVVVGTAIAYRGAVATHLGRLATLLGQLDRADAHFEAALARERRMGARGFEAGVQVAWARALLARGGAEPAAEARRRLEQAAALSSEVGAHLHHRNALALMERLGP